MNIFVLSANPITAAEMMCDKHIPKMVVESGQMLSTAHRMLDGIQTQKLSKSGKRTVKYWIHPSHEDLLYKAVHSAHPCTVWTMQNNSNYIWHYIHFLALSREFKIRFNKNHKTHEILRDILGTPPANINTGNLTPFALAMKHFPSCIVEGDAVTSYRNYYHTAKPFAKWQHGRSEPDWWEGYKGIDI